MRVLVLLMLSTLAHAEDATAEAKRHFRKGAVFFKQGKYDDAIDEYQEAQKHLLLPDFDFNLGQAYRLKGAKRSALEAYKRYLMAVPDGEVADQARSFVVQLSVELDEIEKKQRLEKQEPPPQPSPSPRPLAVALVEATPVSMAKKTGSMVRWVVPVVVVGVVVAAALGVGLGVGLNQEPSAPSTSFGTARPFP